MQVREQIGRSRLPLALTNGGDAGVEAQLGEDLLTGKHIDMKVRSLSAIPSVDHATLHAAHAS